ncbi:DUF2384 domain-containing protein [Geobacter hydrogenophilus]|uniref:Antitoxin Xre/MbcA/ParS-like toxin-binding domain-containing protein n=1 Tax=Geobacter hydrogenophilus TaxID=40983 RepID=A0A9W6LAW5_9BACT|nr:antitoxin Xre/MbcA/ParS toxin-binding domain-containing protein [Geobacter hydrogenophilus]MBT0893748.1 DUF2384 domain-containing protein [Geobacter hydrogenophilus]GLI37557.1 hypothetical protein GHYDROH2_10580 [Geobacter hydrogenophilus]
MSIQVIQEILEGKKAPEERELVAIVRKRLPRGVIDIVARAFGMSPKELCKLLPVSWRTLQRYEADHLLDTHLTDHLVGLVVIFYQVVDVSGSENATEWLKTPNWALGNAQPIEFLDTFAGMAVVNVNLMRLKHGVVS